MGIDRGLEGQDDVVPVVGDLNELGRGHPVVIGLDPAA